MTLGIPILTLVASLLMLSFSPSPFSVLIYSQFAGTVTDMPTWQAITIIMLVSQAIYLMRKSTMGRKND